MTSQPAVLHDSTNPGTKSSADLEHEVRESRADVERTLDAIQDRLSPGQLVDQVAHYLRDNGGDFARNFGDTVRQNPVPVVLVGVGLAWMMFSGRREESCRACGGLRARLRRRCGRSRRLRAWAAYQGGRATAWDEDDFVGAGAAYGTADIGAYGDADVKAGTGPGERAWDAAASAGEGLSDAARRAKEGVGEAADRTREGLHEAADGVRHAADDARGKMGRFVRGARGRAADVGAGAVRGAQRTTARARRYGEQAREGFLETLHRQPLCSVRSASRSALRSVRRCPRAGARTN